MKKISLVVFCAAIFGLLCISGIAKAEDQKYQDKRDMVEGLVNEAADLITAKGQPAIKIITDKNGKFYTKDTYVFVASGETGADIVNPAFQEVEGLPAKDYRDVAAKSAQMAIVNAVKDKDTAWLEYSWPKPGESKPSKKISYLKKIIVNGKTRIIGAGFYTD